jgi:hypothetical protein
VTLTRDLFGLTVFSTGGNNPTLGAVIEDITRNAHLSVPVSANGLSGAQAARVVQRVLEIAGSTDPEAIRAAFRKMKIPRGDPDLLINRVGGLEFGDDGAAVDSTGLIVQWMPDHSQQVVFPPGLANGEPRPIQ